MKDMWLVEIRFEECLMKERKSYSRLRRIFFEEINVEVREISIALLRKESEEILRKFLKNCEEYLNDMVATISIFRAP